MPASDSAGDLLLVALKMPPSSTGIYSNFTPVRASIAGIASWLRQSLGLPTSNMNCGDVRDKTTSLSVRGIVARRLARVHWFDDGHNTVIAASPLRSEPFERFDVT